MAVVGGRLLAHLREIPEGTVLGRHGPIQGVAATHEVDLPSEAERVEAGG